MSALAAAGAWFEELPESSAVPAGSLATESSAVPAGSQVVLEPTSQDVPAAQGMAPAARPCHGSSTPPPPASVPALRLLPRVDRVNDRSPRYDPDSPRYAADEEERFEEDEEVP